MYGNELFDVSIVSAGSFFDVILQRSHAKFSQWVVFGTPVWEHLSFLKFHLVTLVEQKRQL